LRYGVSFVKEENYGGFERSKYFRGDNFGGGSIG
jgi:hypothetical protein